MGKFMDLTGQKFGRLTVVERVENNKDNHIQWLCQCECGKQKVVLGNSLKRGLTRSCGCLSKEVTSKLMKGRDNKYCEVCGTTKGRINDSKIFNMMLCDNHYQQMRKYGKIVDTSTYFKNEVIIHNDYAEIILRNRNYEYVGSALIDIEDISKVENYKWHLNHRGYVSSGHGENTRLLHRVIIECPEDKIVDHINHDKLNNKKNNLRACSYSENLYNTNPRTSKVKTSKFKGVCFNKRRNKWVARITHNKKETCIGYFENEIDAAIAYNVKALEFYKEFALLNEVS